MAAKDFDTQALYGALDHERVARGLTWPAVAREINAQFKDVPARPMSVSTLTGMPRRTVIEGDGALQILRWLRRTPESFAPGGDAGGDEPLPEVSSDHILRFDTRTIFETLESRRVARSLTWQQVASEIGGGVRPESLTRLARGGRTSFPGIIRIARWLGCPVARLTHAAKG